jgi:hypothetical protein
MMFWLDRRNYRPLQLGGAADGVDDAWEFRQHPVAGRLDRSEPVTVLDFGIWGSAKPGVRSGFLRQITIRLNH